MPRLLASVSLRRSSGLPEDEVVNTFAFSTNNPTGTADFDAIQSQVIDFFDNGPVIAGTEYTLSNFLSGDIIRDQVVHEIKIYNVPEYNGGQVPALGAPIATRMFFLDNPPLAPATLPSEVALCGTFHAHLGNVAESVPGGPVGPEGDTRPRARRRGRIYIGPLNAVASQNSGTGPARPNGELRTVLVDAMDRMANFVLPSAGAGWKSWCVWSRTDGQFRPVTGGWVDDAFDTQRRRGDGPTSRLTFTA